MAYENATALDWDSVIENDSTFVLLPEGTYPFEVTGFERARHNGSAKLPPCNKAIVDITIDGGELGHTTVKHNLFLHQKCEGLLCEFFTAIGMRKRGERLVMAWERVPGARGVCKVGVRKWTSDRTGEEMQSNEIKTFLEPVAPAANANSWSAGKF